MLFGVVVAVFFLMHLVPGDPAAVFLGEQATPQAVAELRARLGLDQPLPVQLARYVAGAARGDLGESLFQNAPVAEILRDRLPATIELALAALAVAIALGLLSGIVAALRPGSILDGATMFLSQLGVSMPVFWLGMLLVAFFSVRLQWFPAVGRGEPLVWHLFLPALTLGFTNAAVLSRMMRSSLLGTLGEDYVRTARAKGLRESRVVLAHAFRNALLPVVSLLGVRFGVLLGGSVLTESVFGWPGLGQLAVTAISQRDLPLVQGIVLVFAAMFLAINLVVDVSYAALDPRVRGVGER